MKNTKKNNKTKRKNKKKGFTLVELLAVIIILAIVVGITIPAVLTTTNNAKKKTFETAAQTVANWVDKQYEVYKTGLTYYGVATLDPNFEKLCVRDCGTAYSTISSYIDSGDDFSDFQANSVDLGYSTNSKCDCDKRVNYLTNEFLTAAGVQASNFRTGFYSTSTAGIPSQSVRIIDGKAYMKNSNASMIDWTQYADSPPKTSSNSSGRYYGYGSYSRVYINANTGKSCVTLIAADNGGDYPAKTIACGGICTSDDVNRANYCKSGQIVTTK